MNFLLDTNVLSEIRKPAPDQGVIGWFERVSGLDLYLSVLVVGEIRQGVERRRRRDEHAAEALDTWLQRVVSEYADRILPVTMDVADAWGRMNVPDPLPAVDGLLAATAKVHGMTLVTRNVADVEALGVEVLNPFGDS